MVTLQKFSYRYAEEILNSKLERKKELDTILLDTSICHSSLSRKQLNKALEDRFINKGWISQPKLFDVDEESGNNKKDMTSSRMDFIKDRIGVEVSFTHASYMGIDLLKLQVASYSNLNKIDVGVLIVTTKRFQKEVENKEKGVIWEGSLTFEKVLKYLPYFKSAIHVPIYVIGVDI